jgi:hypothetical protein
VQKTNPYSPSGRNCSAPFPNNAPMNRKLVLVPVLAASALGLHTWQSWSPGAPVYALSAERATAPLATRLRSPEEHDRIRAAHPEPYVLELQGSGGGALCYYGAHHDDALDNPQLEDIRSRWEAFQPTVALCEGRRRGYFLGPLIPRFAGMPESGWVHTLARAENVPLYSLEPDYADEVAVLLKRFAPEHVALYFTLRVYGSESGGRADEALAEDLRRKRTDVEGLRDALPDLAAMDEAWTSAGGEGDWRTAAGAEPGVLGEISDASRTVRGEHMVRILLDLVGRGERVLAVVGSGHVIRQEWALRDALGADPAPDQPR